MGLGSEGQMDFELTREQQAIRAMARDWALAEVAPVIHRYDEAHEFPHEILKSLGKTGLLGALVPEEYGGAALDYVSYALAVEELNRVDASVGITMWAHNSLCTNHIALFGSKEQKAAHLPRLARGEALGAWGLTESGSGSDAAAMQSRAVPDGSRFILNGGKAFITNAGVAELAVVMAVTDPARGNKGISAFVLERGMPGFSAGRPYRKLGLHASNTAELVFDNVAIPGANLLGELNRGFVDTLQVLEGGRVAMAAMAVGIAQAALDQALVYMKQRRAFGKTLAEFNGLQGMIADIGTEVEAARLLTLRAAALKDAGRPAKTAASMAKLFASEVAMRAATKALQIHGGAGYITEFPIERIFRDAKLTEIGEGTSEIQRMVIARDILGLR
jgi:alkylation response protein AidB-like acyl-CoA dehydrogenase